MIVIDTNVVSEMMRDEPDPKVLTWSETVGRLHTTAITLAEVDYGIARLPEGHLYRATCVRSGIGDRSPRPRQRSHPGAARRGTLTGRSLAPARPCAAAATPSTRHGDATKVL